MYFEEFCEERNLKNETIKGYRTTINHYTSYYDMTMDDLINEANEEKLTVNDTVWDLTIRQMTYHFAQINDELEFGFKGSYRFLRPHTLRKFHASNIGLSEDNIDLLQGRSRDSVHATYIKTNPSEFKKVYMSVMENVTIGKINKEIKHEEFTININLNFYGFDYGISL